LSKNHACALDKYIQNETERRRESVRTVDGVDARDGVVVSWNQQLVLGAWVDLSSDETVVFIAVGWWNADLLELLSTSAHLLADLLASWLSNVVGS